MQNDYSLDSLAEFAHSEQSELDKVGLSKQESPSENSIQNILNFSKQYSVRKSKILTHFEQNLN